MVKVNSSPLINNQTSNRERLHEVVVVTSLLASAVGIYSVLFNRANVLSHSIGYNLYASERVLEGAVPYRDFHTLYPPAIFYLNAFLFKWFGVSLRSALLGVLVFKSLTVILIYLSGREIMPRVWALTAAILSLLWLRPNGPFKSVPMHYGALFLAASLYFMLRYENRKRLNTLLLAGAALGFVALFKHNIGAYALAGCLVFLFFGQMIGLDESRVLDDKPVSEAQGESLPVVFQAYQGHRRILALLAGFGLVIVPSLAYIEANHALGPMIRTMLFGPGEFLLSRLAIPLSPIAPLILVSSIAATAYAANKVWMHPAIGSTLWLVLFCGIVMFLLFGTEADVNQIIFYLPMLVLSLGLLVGLAGRGALSGERGPLLIVFIFAAAALMELFPRFAREQSIAAMPFVLLVLFYLLYLSRPVIARFASGDWQRRLALAVLPVTFTIIEGRLFYNTYFEGLFRFKAATPVEVERGRGAYFPSSTAAMIDNAVSYIQERVSIEGNAFAQSDAGTSLLFLANRRNVSNAQFWVGVGVSPGERAATLDRIDKSQTKLIITSDEVLAVERYEPMREYIDRNFEPTVRFEDVLMLERRTK